MTIILNNISATIEQGAEASVAKALTMLKLSEDCIKGAALSKFSVDARRGGAKFVCSVAVTLTEKGEKAIGDCSGITYTVKKEEDINLEKGTEKLTARPVVVGFGPAGMFSALLLAQNGYCPIVLERGDAMEQRASAVDKFWKEGILNPKSNVQFGEGGAGAFSDGKLTTRINDPLCSYVTEQLIKFGAPAEIRTLAKPHIGTDLLRVVVKNIRKEIIALGGEIIFNTTATEFVVEGKKLRSIKTESGEFLANVAIVAVGHSARDTFEAMESAGLRLEPKSFSVGARIEHLQENIDRALYGKLAGHPNLPVGEYQLSHREGNRAAYTFCMCPGGMVVAAASAEGQVVTNGMSYHARDFKNANSAYAVSVSPDDFGTGWRDGIAFQQKLEHSAFVAGGSNGKAPFTTVGKLLGNGRGSNITPSYPLGVCEYPIEKLFPKQVSDMMIKALPILGNRLTGFNSPFAVLTGVETRTSSPLRVARGENLTAENADGLYPSGEGAGYAGGIMSASVDGIRCAAAIINRFSSEFKK